MEIKYSKNIKWNLVRNLTILIFTILFFSNNIFATDLQMEWGNFTLSTQSWKDISMQNSYVSPIVIVSLEYQSTSQDRGIGVWLNNVTENSFEIYASNHQFDSTDNVKVNYFIIEEGNWTFPSTGAKIEAGKFSTNRVGSAGTGNWGCPVHGNKIYFTNNFSSSPIVFSTRATNNNNAWGITFQNNLDDETLSSGIDGACIGLSQANAPSPNSISNYETIYWIAMDEFHSTLSGIEFESLWNLADTGTSGGSWINGYDDSRPFGQNWQTSFATNPVGAIVSQTSNFGGEGGWAILHGMTKTSLNLFIDENIDRSHTKSESGGGFGFTGPIAYGNSAPNSTEININPTFTWQNNIVNIAVNVTDPQSVFTIKNVTGSINYPNSTIKNFSFLNSPASSFSLNTSDLESNQQNFTVPPDESIWLDNWNYRKKFNIIGSNVSDLKNYTLKLYIYNKEGTDITNHVYLSGKAKTDYSDIRFTNSSANSSGLLPYWKEREGSDYAIYWIKFDNLIKDINNTFYIYYNNSVANYTGNGSNTFMYFEDFESYGSELDGNVPSTWSDYNSGTVLLDTEVGGNRVLKKTANNDPSGGKTYLGLNFSNYELLWKTNRINNLAGKINRYAISDENANGYSTYSSSFGPSMKYKLEKRTNGAASQFTPNILKSFATEMDTWYYMKLNRYEGNFKFFFMDLTETVFESYENYDGTYSNFNTLYIHGGQEYWSDDFLLRQYVDPEPYFSGWGDEKKWKNAIDGQTLYKKYSFVDNSKLQDLSKIKIYINISENSYSASVQNSNTYPSLEVSLSNSENSDWQIIGTIFPTLPGIYSISTTNPNLLNNWKFEDNRNIRFRGLNIDNYNSTLYDIIKFEDVITQIDYKDISNNWYINFNDTAEAGFYNVTNIIVCDKGNLCNNKIYNNDYFEITDKGNVTLITPYNNQKFIGVNQSINFTFKVKSSFVNNTCMFYLDGIWMQNTSCPTNMNTSIIYNFSNSEVHNWNVVSIDEFNKTGFSDIYTFHIIENTSVFVHKEITNVASKLYFINVTTNSNNFESNNFKIFDTVKSNYFGGSYSRLYDLFQILTGGTKKLFNWNIVDNEVINYSYTSNNQNYSVADLFIVGLE